MHYLLIFWTNHSGPEIFLIENALAEDVRAIEGLIDLKEPEAKQKAVNEFMKKCYSHARCTYKPDDCLLNGSVRIVNFY